MIMILLSREYCEIKVSWPLRQQNGSGQNLLFTPDWLILVKYANFTPTPPLATVMLSMSQFREWCNLVIALSNHIFLSSGSLSRDYLRHTFGKPLIVIIFVHFVIANWGFCAYNWLLSTQIWGLSLCHIPLPCFFLNFKCCCLHQRASMLRWNKQGMAQLVIKHLKFSRTSFCINVLWGHLLKDSKILA